LALKVNGNVAPDIEKPVPVIVAALTTTGNVPAEASVTSWVSGEFRFTLPKGIVVAFTLRMVVPAPNCKAKVSVTLPALAVSDTAAAEPTEDTVAEKLAVVAPAATVTVVGTVTTLLLLARLTANPPLAAAAFSVTVQLSVPAPVIDPLEQLSPVSTGTPEPLRLTALEAPVEELLVNVSAPVAAPAATGPNCAVKVAV
jgi:hypothetical protein